MTASARTRGQPQLSKECLQLSFLVDYVRVIGSPPDSHPVQDGNQIAVIKSEHKTKQNKLTHRRNKQTIQQRQEEKKKEKDNPWTLTFVSQP